MKYPKRRQYKHAKSQYRLRNWSEYDAGLQRRGDLTVWLSDVALDAWRAPASGKPGGQRRYTDIAIEAALTIPRGLPPSASPEPRASSVAWPSCSKSTSQSPITPRFPGDFRSSARSSSRGPQRIDRSICSSTALGSGFTSDICRNRQGIGLGGSCTSLSTPIQVRS